MKNLAIKSSTKTKAYISTWITVLLSLLLFSVAAMTEIFQLTKSSDSNTVYSNPIRSDVLANLKSIVIKNRLGQFTLQEESGNWVLKKPRVMPLKASTKSKLLETMRSIKVKDIHQYEPINLASFSLDKPVLSISLYTKLNEKVTLNMGIINPINNTTYITVSNQKRIYQVDLLNNKIEAMELADFIESKVFSLDAKDITSFELFLGKNSNSSYRLENKEGTWLSKRFKHISDEQTFKTLATITDIRAHYILDKQDEETLNTINNYLENPLYKVIIKSKNKEVEYKVSSLIRSIPGLKLEKRQSFIIQASDRVYPYIVDKEYLKNFQIRYQNLK